MGGFLKTNCQSFFFLSIPSCSSCFIFQLIFLLRGNTRISSTFDTLPAGVSFSKRSFIFNSEFHFLRGIFPYFLPFYTTFAKSDKFSSYRNVTPVFLFLQREAPCALCALAWRTLKCKYAVHVDMFSVSLCTALLLEYPVCNSIPKRGKLASLF